MMEMTTTRRSKRKSKSIYANPVESSQHKRHKIVKGLKVRGLNGDCTMDYNLDELLRLCIREFALASTSYFNVFLQFDAIN